MTRPMTTREVAARFEVDPRTIQRWLLRGRFPNAFRVYDGVRSPWLIPEEDVTALQAELESADNHTEPTDLS